MTWDRPAQALCCCIALPANMRCEQTLIERNVRRRRLGSIRRARVFAQAGAALSAVLRTAPLADGGELCWPLRPPPHSQNLGASPACPQPAGLCDWCVPTCIPDEILILARERLFSSPPPPKQLCVSHMRWCYSASPGLLLREQVLHGKSFSTVPSAVLAKRSYHRQLRSRLNPHACNCIRTPLSLHRCISPSGVSMVSEFR